MIRASNATGLPAAHNGCLRPTSRRDAFNAFDGECFPTPIVLASSMFDVSSRAKLSVSALAERKIASARPRKYGLLLRAEEEMLLYGQALASYPGHLASMPGGPGALSNRESHEGLGLRRKEFQKPGASLSCARPAAPREAHNGIDAGWSDGSRSIRNGMGGDQAGD